MDYRHRLLRIILNICIPLVVIALVITVLPKVLGYFMPFVVGGIIALIANPLVRFLERKVKLRRKFGTVLIIGAALALVVVGGYAVISWLVEEAMGFIMDLPAGLEDTGALASELFSRIGAIFGILPSDVTTGLNETLSALGSALLEVVSEFASDIGSWAMQAASNVARSIPSAFVMVIITILSAYFFVADKDKLAELYHRHMPAVIKKYVNLLRGNAKRLIGGYFLAQFKIMLVVAVLLTVGLLILRVPFAVIWGILIAILDFLPVLGTGTVLIPWAVLQFVGGHIYMGVGLLVIWIVTQGVHQMVQPKMVGDSMNLNPLATLLFLYLGFRISGIGGMILAVPVGIIVIEIYKIGAFDSLIGAVKELVDLVNEYRGVAPVREEDVEAMEEQEREQEKAEEEARAAEEEERQKEGISAAAQKFPASLKGKFFRGRKLRGQ